MIEFGQFITDASESDERIDADPMCDISGGIKSKCDVCVCVWVCIPIIELSFIGKSFQ